MDFLALLFQRIASATVALLAALGLGAADQTPTFQGYAEGEYVYVASPVAARLEVLDVARGDEVSARQTLFELDRSGEQPARDEAAARLARFEAVLTDLHKGKRQPELDTIEAQLAQAQAMLQLSESQLRRQERLVATNVASRETLDETRAAYERDRGRVAELKAQLETAKLAGREDEIRAAEADVAAARADLAQAEWRLAQMAPTAQEAAVVVDTLYELGEWVPAGAPVVSLLPPGNIKVRFFVPEPLLGTINVGQEVALSCDGCAQKLSATISYIAPNAEYTPPFIYSQDMREKFVYLVEARPDQPQQLRPGQPVDVTLPTS